MTEKQRLVENLLAKFDFGKVRQAMEAVGWEWHENGVPSISDLHATARRCLEGAIREHKRGESIQVRSGGFRACVDARGKPIIAFELEYVEGEGSQ